MKKGKIIIISGPSGSGKTTLYKKLLTSRNIRNRPVRSVSVTTRKKRPGERHGRDYFFVSQKMFDYKKRAGHFLESEKVFDNSYGTPKRNLQRILMSGKSVLLCIDVKGARTVRRRFPQAVTVFVKTASFRTLEARLKGRGSEKKDIRRIRLRRAREELKEAKNYDHLIVNDNLHKAYGRLEAIVKRELGGPRNGRS